MTVTVRGATPADLDAIVVLCDEHAAFERAELRAEHVRGSLGRFLFAERPRAWCLLAEAGGEIAGYATYSREFSTWNAAEFLSMDCLYVRAGHRNSGIGLELMRAVGNAAASLGCEFIEWQTPDWNTAAMRFYDRLGATGKAKMRYRWMR